MGRPMVKHAWASGAGATDKQVNHDTFHRLLDEYREAKRGELSLELKAKQLAAQLARTEEAAKRALVQTDATARGGAAQRLLDAERALFKMRDENAELRSKLSREKKRAAELKLAHDENKRRLDTALTDQRQLSCKIGDLQRKHKLLARRPDDDGRWDEEAGRRFVAQQEELVQALEENARLQKLLAQAGTPIAAEAEAVRGGAQAQAQVREERLPDQQLSRLQTDMDASVNREGSLRGQLASAHARVEELERAFAKQVVVDQLKAGDGSVDDTLQQARQAASQLEKRCAEHKAELDAIRLTAARMQVQLEETHKQLHEQHKACSRLEDDRARLLMEAARCKDLEALLAKERAERLALERERTALQSTVRPQLGGASAEQGRGWQEERGQLRKQVADLQLEAAAAQQRLQVLRQADGLGWGGSGTRAYATALGGPAAPGIQLQGANAAISGVGIADGSAWLGATGRAGAPVSVEDVRALVPADRRPDADKGDAEVRRELSQLRDVWHADQLELQKLHKVLAVESGLAIEAKAALEEGHKQMDCLRRDLDDGLRHVQRERDSCEERVRKLELAYSGASRTLRTSRARESRAADPPDDLGELLPGQNLMELHVCEASLEEDALGRNPSTFFTFDFFMHDTQATPVVASSKPLYDTLVQYIVDSDAFLIEYLDTHVLELELNRTKGWDYEPVGVARVALQQVLQDVEAGAALGGSRAFHHADILSSGGKRVGRVRLGFAFRRPLADLLKEYRARLLPSSAPTAAQRTLLG